VARRPGVAQFLYLSALLHAIRDPPLRRAAGRQPERARDVGSMNAQLVAPAGPIAVPERMEPIVPMPLADSRRASSSRRPIVTPQVSGPQRMAPITPPQMKLESMLPSPKIEVVPLPGAQPAIPVPAPVAPIFPSCPTVERTMAEPPIARGADVP
jgi:hypothetical protein